MPQKTRTLSAARVAAASAFIVLRSRHGNLDGPERADNPSPAMTVPVTVARRDIARRGGRRAVGRAGFATAAPMPALVPSLSQRGGQLLLDQPFDEAPDPNP
jgi:hypothetical protein